MRAEAATEAAVSSPQRSALRGGDSNYSKPIATCAEGVRTGERSVRPFRWPAGTTSWRPFQLGVPARGAPLGRRRTGERRASTPVVRDRRWQDRDVSRRRRLHAVCTTGCAGSAHGIIMLEPLPAADALAAADTALRRRVRRRRARTPRGRHRGRAIRARLLRWRGGTPNRVRDDAGPEEQRTPPITTCPSETESCCAVLLPGREPRDAVRPPALAPGCIAARTTECPWAEDGLPFYVVDEEIYRLLPSSDRRHARQSRLGLDAGGDARPVRRPTRAMQRPGHGFTYAPRSKTAGCLVPEC